MKSHYRVRHALAAALLIAVCWCAAPSVALAQQPPAPSPAQEGFVPIDQLQPKEELPAAPFLMAAYAVAWLVIFGYIWSLWTRLSRVEDEIASVRQQAPGGGRR
jgi:CcmD family protein